MSELRQQLESAKAAYRGARYPGNLADAVLPEVVADPVETRSWRWRLVAGGLAAAATIAVLAWPRQTATDTGPTDSSTTVALMDDSAPRVDGVDAGDAIEEETQTVSHVVDDVPTLPEIGPLWAAAESDFAEDEYEQLVPAFPPFSTLNAGDLDSDR